MAFGVDPSVSRQDILDVFSATGLEWVVPDSPDVNPALWLSLQEYTIAHRPQWRMDSNAAPPQPRSWIPQETDGWGAFPAADATWPTESGGFAAWPAENEDMNSWGSTNDAFAQSNPPNGGFGVQQHFDQGRSALGNSVGDMAKKAKKSAHSAGEKASRRAERTRQDVSQRTSEMSESMRGPQGVSGMMKQAEQRAVQRSEEMQQKVAQQAMNGYVKQASGGLVTSVPPGVSNATLGYAKQNPKEAMKIAKMGAKLL